MLVAKLSVFSEQFYVFFLLFFILFFLTIPKRKETKSKVTKINKKKNKNRKKKRENTKVFSGISFVHKVQTRNKRIKKYKICEPVWSFSFNLTRFFPIILFAKKRKSFDQPTIEKVRLVEEILTNNFLLLFPMFICVFLFPFEYLFLPYFEISVYSV